MSAVIDGLKVWVYLNGEPTLLAVTNELSLNNQLRDTTNKYGAGWASFAGGLLSAEGSAEGLFAEVMDNLLTFSDDVSNAIWVNSGLTVSGTLLANPNSRITAQRVTSVANGDSLTQTFAAVAAGDYTFSLYLKNAAAGTISIELGDDTGSDTLQITMTSSWVRYEIPYTMTTGVDPFVKIFSDTGDTATQFDVSMCMVNSGDTAISYVPSSKNFSQMFAGITAGTLFTTKIASYGADSQIYSGSAAISDLKRTSPQNENVTYSFNFKFSGQVSEANA